MPGKTYQQSMVDFIESYYEQHGDAPVESSVIAAWVLQTGQWEPPPKKVLQMLQRDISAAAGKAKHHAPDGSETRTYGCLKTVTEDEKGKSVQKMLWIDIRKATPEQALVALRARLDQAKCDVFAVRRDLEVYNKYYLPEGEEPLQLSFNFDDVDNLLDSIDPVA